METHRYKIDSTSSTTAKAHDIVLGISENGLTRRVLRAELIGDNPKNPDNNVKIAIVHQRKLKLDEWEDKSGGTLRDLKAGEALKIQLDTAQTRALAEHLWGLFAISADGVHGDKVVVAIQDEDEVLQVEKGRARLIQRMLEADHGDELWLQIVSHDSDFATDLALRRVYEERCNAVAEFSANIDEDNRESYWQALLEKNWWMFGAAYIRPVGERRLNIRSQTDYSMMGEDGFLDIVEIKKPGFPFWRRTRDDGSFLYRGKYPVPHEELQCAITQACNYVHEAEEKSDSQSFRDDHEGVVPIKPECLVVHGRSNSWGEKESKAFRLLNDRLHGIRVITFDHLLARARRAVELLNPDTDS